MARISVKQSSRQVKVDLLVHLEPKVEAGEPIFVVGNIPALGSWKPDAVPLPAQGERSFSITFAVAAGTPVEFKITRGSWKTQAVYLDSDDRFPPDNRVLCPVENTSIEVTVIDWLDRIVVEVDPVVGDLRTHEPLAGEGLREPRSLQVWLPPTYRRSRRSYPVVYMHDGQNLFEPATSFAGQDWKVDETVSFLIGEGRMREVIVVGVPNSPDRMEEYNLAKPRGKAYSRFLIERVKPFIDRTYRTKRDPANTAVMGSSMGGLVSFQLAWNFPDVFGLAGCLSSAFYKSWIQLSRMIRTNPGPGRRLRIYLDTGELEPIISSSFRRMEELLVGIGMEPGVDFLAYFEPGATHSERAWGDRLHVPFEFLIGPPAARRG